jgi:DNA-binding PadR family transcriptional regulator
MDNEPRMTTQTLRVLGAILDTSGGELSGAQIGKVAKLQSGSLYPILMRLEDAGWLSSRWETEEPTALGRPRRRFYRLTGLGQTRARAAFQDLLPSSGRLAWA